jgi:hypothetical protein
MSGMNTKQRRSLMGFGLLAAGLLAAYSYTQSLVPASHPDHDHGILNLDAGGRLMVETRSGKARNLVGQPGHVLVIHFFSTAVPEAADELRGLLRFKESVSAARQAEFLLIAQDKSFAVVNSWMKQSGIQLPVPDMVVIDPDGDTTKRLNSKRPLETMFFTPQGKLSSQAHGRMDWLAAAAGKLSEALGGGTIE